MLSPTHSNYTRHPGKLDMSKLISSVISGFFYNR